MPVTDEDAELLKKLRGSAISARQYIDKQNLKAINTGANVFAQKEYKHNQRRLETMVSKIAVILAKYR